LYAGSHDGEVLGRMLNALSLSLSPARLAIGSIPFYTAGTRLCYIKNFDISFDII
jgi:hypothetical protein